MSPAFPLVFNSTYEMFSTMKAVWIIQLGTPDDASPSSVGRYLREFLMDRRMIDLPYALRAALVCGVIVPFRSTKSASAYQNVWSERGSPLRYHTEDLVSALRLRHPGLEIMLSMRYGQPSIESGYEELMKKGATEIFVMPLFPQYASATTGSVHERIFEISKHREIMPALRFLPSFYAEPGFIDAFAERIQKCQPDRFDRILFSFHGIPERYLKKAHASCLQLSNCCEAISSQNAFCYRAQSVATAKKLVYQLGLKDGRWLISFQSRLGREPWASPYTDHVLKAWAQEGIKKVLVVSPSFVADCLETVEEIAIRERESFLEAGGEELELVPSLNAESTWVDFLSSKISHFAEVTD